MVNTSIALRVDTDVAISWKMFWNGKDPAVQHKLQPIGNLALPALYLYSADSDKDRRAPYLESYNFVEFVCRSDKGLPIMASTSKWFSKKLPPTRTGRFFV